MFAIKQIIQDSLYALETNTGGDVFHECFDNWQDVLYLRDYFSSRPDSLIFYGVTVSEAVEDVLDESEQFFDDILKYAEDAEQGKRLDNIIFEPLHEKDDFDIPLIQAKAKGKTKGKSYLRLYAIRLSDGAYIVVGGLIKTTRSLQEDEEGIKILEKLRVLADYLRSNDFLDAFDIVVIIV
mgnify:CR=1 FL=1